MIGAEAAPGWLPTAMVSALAIFAAIALVRQAWSPGRKYWLAALVLIGAGAIAATAWREDRSQAALGAEAARLDAIARLLERAPGATSKETFDAAATAIAALNARITELEGRILTVEERFRGRTIDDDPAAKLAAYLRPLGSHRVVVSCVPDDVEAYRYANQIANVLRTAGWDALGPETTTIFGEASAMGVTLYVHDGTAPPEAANLLLDAFTRFNIPYRSGIAPSDAIPDPETVELFVGRKP